MKITQIKSKDTFKPFSISILVESEDERDELIINIERVISYLPKDEAPWLQSLQDICENNKATE